jgi:hypothetical protein
MKKYKQHRREDALIRQQKHDARTPEQQLAFLDEGGFKAVKERKKLHEKIEAKKK